MSATDLRAEHRQALVDLVSAWAVPIGRPDEHDFTVLAELLLEYGWRPAYDGTLEIYEGREGGYRWRAVAENGQIVAGPQEGYHDREHAAEMGQKITGIYVEDEA